MPSFGHIALGLTEVALGYLICAVLIPTRFAEGSDEAFSHSQVRKATVLVDPVFKALRKQRRMPAIDPLNKARC